MSDDDLDELLLDDAGREPEWSAFTFGHVHVPYVRRWRPEVLVNVASVGLPMDGDQRAAYGILTWNGDWHAEHRRVFYPVPVVAQQMRTGGMPPASTLPSGWLRPRTAVSPDAGMFSGNLERWTCCFPTIRVWCIFRLRSPGGGGLRCCGLHPPGRGRTLVEPAECLAPRLGRCDRGRRQRAD